MDFLRAIVLGAVQGLTEFIPVSSSGHLILVPRALGWSDQGLAFDAALHIGTLAAVLAYFRRDWIRLTTAAINDVSQRRTAIRAYSADTRLLGLTALGTVPAAVSGLLFDDWIEANVREPWVVATALAGAGVVMLIAERVASLAKGADAIGLREAIIVGLAQACALIPGVSRSGATISAGLAVGLRREEAARFAFLLGTPTFAGAALLKAFDLRDANSDELLQLAAGTVTAALVGFLAISWLLRFLRTRSLVPFVVYRFAVAAVTFAVLAVRGS